MIVNDFDSEHQQQPVKGLGAYPFEPSVGRAFPADAVNDVGAGFDFLEHFNDAVGIVLQIGIDGDVDVGFVIKHACQDGALVTEVA